MCLLGSSLILTCTRNNGLVEFVYLTTVRMRPVCSYAAARNLKGTDYTYKMSVIVHKGDKFCNFLFAFLHTYWKGVFYKRKYFPPCGRKFFSFREDPILEGRQNGRFRVASLKIVSIPLKAGLFTSGFSQACLFEVVFVKCVCIWRTSVFFQFYGVLSGVIYNYSPPTFFIIQSHTFPAIVLLCSTFVLLVT